MNRTDRLFAITVLLQTRRRVRARDIARLFEVSERTVYRDIVSLSESGIPVIATPGEGYELDPGFRLPAIQLTPPEARALFLAAAMLQAQAGGRLAGDVESSLGKVVAVLSPEARAEAERLLEILSFVLPAHAIDFDDPLLAAFQQAIHEKRVVWLRYHSLSGEATTEREIEPDALHYSDGNWYASGYCRLRRERRSFRFNRIEKYALRSETFLPRLLFPPPASPVTVRVRFEPGVLRWVRERQHYAFQEETPEGEAVVMRYQVEDLRELRSWLLGWGLSAEVLEPPELRESLAGEIAAMLEKYRAG